MERDAVRGCGAGRERDDGAQGSAAQQVGADAAAGTAGGGGRGHEQHGGAALAEMGQGVLDPGEFGLGAGGEAVLPAGVVGKFVVAPVALVERRVAEHRVDGEPGKASARRVSPVRTASAGPAVLCARVRGRAGAR